eukprot:scaffold177261_cov53-Attheya_sp.AAC.2
MSHVQTVHRSHTVLRYGMLGRHRLFSKGAHSYIEEWQASIVKPVTFYEAHCAPGVRNKKYFYSVDLQGRVFLGEHTIVYFEFAASILSLFPSSESGFVNCMCVLLTIKSSKCFHYVLGIEETIPKNIATSIKNVQFLDFFTRRIRKVKPREVQILEELGVNGDYPYVSPCGSELNFIRPADVAIVFHSLENMYESPNLLFGATLTQSFSPEKLAISNKSGHLYHEIGSSKRRASAISKSGVVEDSEENESMTFHPSDKEYGLIRSSLAVTLCEHIIEGSMNKHNLDDTTIYSGMDFHDPITGKLYPIIWLPNNAEPGPWALPNSDDDSATH